MRRPVSFHRSAEDICNKIYLHQWFSNLSDHQNNHLGLFPPNKLIMKLFCSDPWIYILEEKGRRRVEICILQSSLGLLGKLCEQSSLGTDDSHYHIVTKRQKWLSSICWRGNSCNREYLMSVRFCCSLIPFRKKHKQRNKMQSFFFSLITKNKTKHCL